jgi:ABC-type polysaccharide/polyol phosphate export permease
VLSVFAFGLTGLGFVLAWWLDSTQGFHAVMNLLLVPMWLLSGAVFPAYGASKWIQNIMLVNPMTYGVSAVRSVLAEGASGTGPSLATSLLVLTAFGIAMLIAGAVSVQTKKLN